MLTTVALSVVALMLSLREPPSNVYLVTENADNTDNTFMWYQLKILLLNFPTVECCVAMDFTSQWSKGCQGSPEGRKLQLGMLRPC